MAALEGYLRLSAKFSIHLIDNEVFAMSVVPSVDFLEISHPIFAHRGFDQDGWSSVVSQSI